MFCFLLYSFLCFKKNTNRINTKKLCFGVFFSFKPKNGPDADLFLRRMALGLPLTLYIAVGFIASFALGLAKQKSRGRKVPR